MSDMVGTPIDWFSRVAAHLWWGSATICCKFWLLLRKFSVSEFLVSSEICKRAFVFLKPYVSVF